MRKGMIVTNNNIILTWKDSLNLFKIKTLKLFILASLNNALRSFYIFFKQFWWVSLLLLVSLSSLISVFLKFAPIIVLQTRVNWLIILPILSLFILTIFSLLLFMLVLFLVVRPSSEKKNNMYIKNNLSKIWGLFLISVILGLFYALFIKFFITTNAISYDIYNKPTIFSIFSIVSIFIYSAFTFAMFFFLDSNAKILSIFPSFLKSFKLMIYYLPATVFIMLIYLINSSFGNIMIFISQKFYGNLFLSICFWTVYTILTIFLSLISLSLFANYYTMVRYKNYKLFYGDK